MKTKTQTANVLFIDALTNKCVLSSELEFRKIRGVKVALKNCINRNIYNLQKTLGLYKRYRVDVKLNGETIMKTTLGC